jgi:glycosidase
MAVRTPMQWDATANGGFSTAPPRRLVQRPVPGGYGPEHVNVADQKRDPDSLWSFVRALIQTYRECPELGWGEFAVLDQPHRQVLAHRCRWQGSSVVAVHNLSAQPVTTRLKLEPDDLGSGPPARLEDLFAHEEIETSAGGVVELTLDGYGHRWLRARQ